MKTLKSLLFCSLLCLNNVSAETLSLSNQFNQTENSTLSSSLSIFDNQENPLTAEEAFKLSTNMSEKNVTFNFNIAKDHYLYVDQFELYINDKKKEIKIENSFEKEDLHYGKVKVIKGFNSFIVNSEEDIKNYKLIYQGCSEKFNICYDKQTYTFFIPDSDVIKQDEKLAPNIEKNTTIKEIPSTEENTIIKEDTGKEENKTKELIKVSEQLNSYVGSEEYIKNILENSHLWQILGLFFLGGILISFTPCVLPMIPIVSSIVLGKEENISQLRAFSLSLSYVIGSSITYAILGLIAALLSENIQAYMQNIYVITSFSIILFILGLSMFGLFNINGSQNLNNIAYKYSNKLKGGEHIQVFIMGMLSTLILSPCVAAPIAAAITYISTTNDILTGTLSMFFFGLGIGFVLILITTTLNKFKIKSGSWMNEIKYITGVIIILVSIYLLSNVLKEEYIYIAYISTILGYLINFYARNYEKFKYLLILLIIFVASGLYFKPVKVEKLKEDSIIVNNIQELEKEIQNSEYTLLKFTADWCIYCKQMDNEILKNKNYEEKLKNYKIVYIDITEENEKTKELREKFKVSAPPVIVFLQNDDIVYKETGYNKNRLIDIIDQINLEIKKIGEKNGR